MINHVRIQDWQSAPEFSHAAEHMRRTTLFRARENVQDLRDLVFFRHSVNCANRNCSIVSQSSTAVERAIPR